MPTYDYRCPKCGKFTISQGIKEKALENCPTCGAAVHRLIGKNVNIIYKCSGFYSTDTRSPSGVRNTAETENTMEAKQEDNNTVKSDALPEQKTETNTEAKTETRTKTKTESKAVNE